MRTTCVIVALALRFSFSPRTPAVLHDPYVLFQPSAVSYLLRKRGLPQQQSRWRSRGSLTRSLSGTSCDTLNHDIFSVL